MRSLLLLLATLSFTFFNSSNAHAAGGSHFGLYGGAGVPYLAQFGLTYVTGSGRFSADLGYGMVSLTTSSISTSTSVSLKKPELNLKWHPFAGAFYFGVGLGQQTLEAKATETTTSETAKISVTSMTVMPNLGWMWGIEGGGFFVGVDAGFQIPSGAKTTIESSLPPTDQTYIDAKEQADKLGETSFPTITFIRLGYLF